MFLCLVFFCVENITLKTYCLYHVVFAFTACLQCVLNVPSDVIKNGKNIFWVCFEHKINFDVSLLKTDLKCIQKHLL